MELTLLQYEQIQQYLNGEMKPVEEKLFLAEVNANKKLQEFLQFEQEFRLNLELIDEPSLTDNDFNIEKQFDDAAHIRDLVTQIGSKWLEDDKRKSTSAVPATEPVKKHPSAKPIHKVVSLPFWFSIAAAACLLFAITNIIWFMTNKSDSKSPAANVPATENQNGSKNETLAIKTDDSLSNLLPVQTAANYEILFKRFYKKDEAPKQKPIVLADALIDYENANYKTLQNFNLTELPSTRGPMEDDINSNQYVKELGHYYKGLAFIQSNNDKQVSTNMQWVISNANNKQLVFKAQWYLALFYVQNGNINKAITLLTSLSNTKNAPNNRQAKELLKLLKP